MTKKRSLTGIRPTGDIHLGNYLGTIKPALENQNEFECLYFIADLHSLTTRKNPVALRQSSLDVAATWMALGLDVNKHIMYLQSEVPYVTEFAWYLGSCTGYGLLEKAHSFKDAKANNKEVNFATFAYPVLMAADILMYDADIVPVGKDQKQHVEMCRDMAGSVNAIYGENLLKLPEVSIRESVMTIPGLDGRKMSKSYNNTIPIFAAPKQLRKKIMSLTTDSTALEEPKSMKENTLGDLYKLFGTQDEYNDLEKRLNAGGLGWGHAKDELFQVIDRDLSDARERYNELRKDEEKLRKILTLGAEKANAIALPILNKVRSSMGFA